jgi:hypothetical protein
MGLNNLLAGEGGGGGGLAHFGAGITVFGEVETTVNREYTYG